MSTEHSNRIKKEYHIADMLYIKFRIQKWICGRITAVKT